MIHSLSMALLLGLAAVSAALACPADAVAGDDGQTPDTGFDLAKHRGTHRPLLIFTSSADNPLYVMQKDQIEQHWDGFKERDMLLVEVVDGGSNRAGDRPLTSPDAQALRQRFRIGPDDGFVVILIGKDGTEKFRWRNAVPADALFERIDAMPMRKQEIDERKPGS